MPKLPKYDLVKQGHDWRLVPEGGGRAIAVFDTKEDATRGGALAGKLGPSGGSVRIHTGAGTFQEERTFPRSADPKKSPG
jgi:hypothetical protein